ncbi:uncharacterized protein KZ484_015389 [Pholidichthys leucotaenia]
MSLQVCQCCGWSKVTTYHGLRTHQGRMGCTPNNERFAEPEQRYLWDYAGVAKKDFTVDFYAYVKSDYSNLSLQVCFCGWSKMTTYHGLRTHQGKMGCTPKGVKILKEEHDWMDQRGAQVDHRKKQRAQSVTVKKENMEELPRTNICTDSAPTAAIKEEHKSFSQHPSQRPTNSKSGPHQKLRGPPPPPSVNRAVPAYLGNVHPKEKKTKNHTTSQKGEGDTVDGYWTTDCSSAPRIKSESESSFPVTQPYFQRGSNNQPQGLFNSVQGRAGRSKDKERTDQTVSQGKNSIRERPTYGIVPLKEKDKILPKPPRKSISTNSATVTVNKDHQSSASSVSQQHSQRSTDSNSGHRLQEFSVPPQQNRPNMEHLTPAYNGNVVRPKERKMKTQTSQSAGRAEEMYWIVDGTSDYTTVPTRIKDEPKSPFQTPQRSITKTTKKNQLQQDFSACKQVKASPREPVGLPLPVPPKKEDLPLCTARRQITKSELQQKVQTTEKEDNHVKAVEMTCKSVPDFIFTSAGSDVSPKEDPTPSFNTPQPSIIRTTEENDGSLKHDFPVHEQSLRKHAKVPPPVPPKRKDSPSFKARLERIKSGLKQKVETKGEENHHIRAAGKTCESVPDFICTCAEVDDSPKEDPALSCEDEQNDITTGRKVKDLARLFLAAAAGPKERQQLPQVKRLSHCFPATTPAQPKEKDAELPQLSQLPDFRSNTVKMNPAAAIADTEEDPKQSCFSGVKVKDLVRLFSATAVQQKAAQPKEQKPPQAPYSSVRK